MTVKVTKSETYEIIVEVDVGENVTFSGAKGSDTCEVTFEDGEVVVHMKVADIIDVARHLQSFGDYKAKR